MLRCPVVKRDAERSTFLHADRRLVVRDLFYLCSIVFRAGRRCRWPPRVVAVRVVTESGSVLEQNPPQLTIQPGQPFSMDAESASLRELFRSGRFADLRAELIDVPGGVRLDFVVRQNYYINRVQIEGLREPPGEALAISALRLNLGEIFRESDMKEALDRLRQTLEDDGQYQAKVDYEATPTSRHAADGHFGARDAGRAGADRRHHDSK